MQRTHILLYALDSPRIRVGQWQRDGLVGWLGGWGGGGEWTQQQRSVHVTRSCLPRSARQCAMMTASSVFWSRRWQSDNAVHSRRGAHLSLSFSFSLSLSPSLSLTLRRSARGCQWAEMYKDGAVCLIINPSGSSSNSIAGRPTGGVGRPRDIHISGFYQ